MFGCASFSHVRDVKTAKNAVKMSTSAHQPKPMGSEKKQSALD